MAKRMKLISESEFKQLTALRGTPIINSHQKLDSKVQQANLLLSNTSIPDDIKVRLYSSLMQSIGLQLQNILNTPILVKEVGGCNHIPEVKNASEEPQNVNPTQNINEETPIDEENAEASNDISLNIVDQQFLRKLPDKCLRKASEIMHTLKQSPDLISWNKNGEVSFFGQEYEKGTSIVDLLSYLVHELKWKVAPKGTNRFLLCAKRLNIPVSLMRPEVRQMLTKDIDQVRDVKSASDSPTRISDIKQKLKGWISFYDEDLDDEVFKPAADSTP